MNFELVLVLFSSISFFIYGIVFINSRRIKAEFDRFGLAKFRILTSVLELLGASGLLVGLYFNPIMMISSGGLSLLMLCAFVTRIKVKDSFLVSLPSIFYMLLNAYIFYLQVDKNVLGL